MMRGMLRGVAHPACAQGRSAGGWVIHNGFITSDDLAIGSIVKVDNKWLVEILWSGPTGDIKFEAESNTAALAFIKDVEKTFEAFTGSEAP
jgi:hypothetical protein